MLIVDWTTGMVDYWTGHVSMLKSHWSTLTATLMEAYCLSSIHAYVQLATVELGSMRAIPISYVENLIPNLAGHVPKGNIR